MTSLATASTAAVDSSAMSSTALAADAYNTSRGLTFVGKPLGMHGVDPVAFLDLGNRSDGTANHTAEHDGVAYYFSSNETMETIKSNPAAYLPENGGYCTFGVSVGKKTDGNPKFAAIIDEKLYVFLNEDIFRMFQEDKAGTISKAETNWPKIRPIAPADL